MRLLPKPHGPCDYPTMPIRNRRKFDHRRARRILDILDMSGETFRKSYNKHTGANAYASDVSAWLSGKRTIPDAAVVLLKALVWCARLRRSSTSQEREAD